MWYTITHGVFPFREKRFEPRMRRGEHGNGEVTSAALTRRAPSAPPVSMTTVPGDICPGPLW